MPFNFANADWGRILSGLGSGLMQAGTPGGNFGQGLMQGTQFYDQGVDRRRAASLEDMRLELEKQQAEADRLANVRAAEQLKRQQDFLASLGQPAAAGGVQTASGPMMGGGIDPRVLQFAQAYPDQAPSVLKDVLVPKAQEPKTTDDLTEYQFYKSQGGTDNFTTWMRGNKSAGAPSTKIDMHAPDAPVVGTITPDYVLAPDGKGGWYEKVIPGSKTDLEQKAAANKDAKTQNQAETTADVVSDDVNRALDLVHNASGLPSTGAVGGALQGIPGTNAHNLQQILIGLKANISFDRLQQMRQNSPTGGALGSVSDNEGKKLESVYGSLEQSQGTPQFEYNLKRFYNVYNDVVHGEGKGPKRFDLSGPANAGPNVVNELPPGFE